LWWVDRETLTSAAVTDLSVGVVGRGPPARWNRCDGLGYGRGPPGSPKPPACWSCRDGPPGMRVIVRKERHHPGAQLRFTDHDGLRLTALATNTRRGQLPDLELRHRRRARCEDRIRAAKNTGLQNLPLHGFNQNQIWCAIVQLACDLIAWTQTCPARSPRPTLGTQTPTPETVLHRRGRSYRSATRSPPSSARDRRNGRRRRHRRRRRARREDRRRHPCRGWSRSAR
jgi:hypothetical protein